MKKFMIAGGVFAVAVLVGYSGTTMILKGDNFIAKPDGGQANYPITKVFNFKKDWNSEIINSQGPCSDLIADYRASLNLLETINDKLKKSKKGSIEYKKLIDQKAKADEQVKKANKTLDDCN